MEKPYLETPSAPPRRYLGLALKLVAFAALIALASHADDAILSALDLHVSPETEPALHRAIMMATAVYIVLMALPFFPGIEIALGMMMLFGAPIVPLVYFSTVVALLIAFLIGRLVPPDKIIRAFDRLGLMRARDMLTRLEEVDAQQRLALLQGTVSWPWMRLLLKHRYLAVAIALNTPGNIVLGDGGGIAMAAGFSRLFTLPAFALTVLLAVSPIPLILILSKL